MGRFDQHMVKIAAGAVLLAWVCLIHSSEAVPIQTTDTASLAQGAAHPESLKQEESAVAAAERGVEAAKSGRNEDITQLQPPTPMHGDDKENKAVDRMVNEVTNSGGKIDHDELTRDTDAISMHAQEPRRSDNAGSDGVLKPGQKGFLAQQITGPVKPFKQTMADINHRLQRKHQEERQMAYQHDEAARLAHDASRAVGAMAAEIGKEAEQNAQQKAAAAAECAMKLKSTSDEAEKMMIAKECSEALSSKKEAYDEAANAMAASQKAISAAGENEGKIVGTAGLHEDGISDLLRAQKAATGAKLKLEMHDREAKKDEEILANRQKLENDTNQLMQKAQMQEQAAQDAYDLRVASAEAAPPPRVRQRQPQPERLTADEANTMNSAMKLPTPSKNDARTNMLKQDKEDLKREVEKARFGTGSN